MKTVTLNASGIKLSSTIRTVVTKIINPDGHDGSSKIVVDEMKNIEISLGSNSANELGIDKNVEVTLAPVTGSSDGSFTLTVGKKVSASKAATEAPRTRGGSPASSVRLSNDDI